MKSSMAARSSSACGFYDHSHFTNSFKRHYGITPLGYRAQQARAALGHGFERDRIHGRPRECDAALTAKPRQRNGDVAAAGRARGDRDLRPIDPDRLFEVGIGRQDPRATGDDRALAPKDVPTRSLADDERPIAPEWASAALPALGAMVRQRLAAGQMVQLDRYVVLREIGQGGMALVFVAYDEKLDRRVAIKILREGAAAGPIARARMQREAQALARLSHPNVVQVYDVGEHDDDLFLAMEYIEGVSLGSWLSDPTRGWRQILAMFLQVGEGLCAAHRAEMVHRDLKPSNVLIDPDSRARVVDFGLARTRDQDRSTQDVEIADAWRALAAAAIDEPESAAASMSHRSPLISTITMGGTVLGTPAYMAPEQAEGAGPDARSDQFSFCVMLYEALYGVRPFAGTSPNAIVTRIAAQTIEPGTDARGAPAWLRPLILRGLSAAPDDRWPTMDLLLAALRRDPARRQRRWLALGTPVAALGIAGLSLTFGPGQSTEAERFPCTGAREQWGAHWNDDARQRGQRAFEATALGFAAEGWARARASVDDYVERWSAAHLDRCITHRRAEISSELYDRQIVCLHTRLIGLEAIIETWGDADAKVVERAARAVTGLGDPDACRDPALMTAEQPPARDPAHDDHTAVLRTELARIEGLRSAGRLAAATDAARAVVDRARALQDPVIIAEAELRYGLLLDETGAYARAEAMLRQAVWSAIEAGHVYAHGHAASSMVLVVGQRLARYDDVDPWIEHGRAAVRRSADGRMEADFERQLAGVELGRGRPETALARLDRSIELAEHHAGPDDLGLAASLANRGKVLGHLGRHDEAREALERAQSIRHRVLGPFHPTYAMGLYALGNLEESTGHHLAAIERFEQAITTCEASLGPDHIKTAIARFGLANNLHYSGRSEQALPLLTAAVEAFTEHFGPRHPNVVIAHNNLGLALMALQRWDRARQHFEISRDRGIEVSGPRHLDVGRAWGNLGQVALALEDWDEAARALQLSLEIYEDALGADHFKLGFPLTGLGRVALARGRYAEAVALLERALVVREQGPVHHRAKTQSYLARALWHGALDRPRAHQLSAAARALYEESGRDDMAEAHLFVPPT